MTAPTVDLPPEVRGYIAALQERVRDLEGKFGALHGLFMAGAQTCDKALSGVDVAVPEGVHSITDPRRVDHEAVDDDGPWCEWVVECACGWSDDGSGTYEVAEVIGRMHAGYYGITNGEGSIY